MEHICPCDALNHFGIDSLDLPSALNYSVLDEICAAVEKDTDIILDFSAHDDLDEGLPLAMDFYVYHKRLQKAQIISDLLCYGPCPEPDDPVEQRLTISALLVEYGLQREYSDPSVIPDILSEERYR